MFYMASFPIIHFCFDDHTCVISSASSRRVFLRYSTTLNMLHHKTSNNKM